MARRMRCAAGGAQTADAPQAARPPLFSATQSSTDPSGTKSSTDSNSASAPASPAADGSDTEQARTGSWSVADAGTLEFQTKGVALKLVSADATSGWNRLVTADSAKEIEVHVNKGDTDWKFEAELGRRRTGDLPRTGHRRTYEATVRGCQSGGGSAPPSSFQRCNCFSGTLPVSLPGADCVSYWSR